MNFSTSLRDKRHFYGPTHYSIANYCTETRNVMKPTFGDEYFLDNLHNLIPEPLKKSLADTIIEEKMPPKNEFSQIDLKTNDNQIRNDTSPLTGITNFLTGVMNVISSAMFFSKRKTDLSSETRREMAGECAWQPAKSDDENKILQDEKRLNDKSDGNTAAEMADCKAAAAHCQNKLDQVRLLLSKPVPCTVKVKRRPKKVFVEPGSVEDCFEDAFAPEDFESLSNNSYLEYVSPYCYHDDNFHEISAPKIRNEKAPLCETTHIVTNVPETMSEETPYACKDTKEVLIASCEDKLSKLKALLQERKKKIIQPELLPEVIKDPPKLKPVSKIKDKHYKNSKRCTDKRRKSKMRQNINNDLLFANEINTEDLSSVENSPSTRNIDNVMPKPTNLEYFDEISGRFHSASVTDSEDSFQIVFNDSPRLRRPSDCESEDSFIVFDDSQDSCYTTNDVFNQSSDSDSCDSDSEFSDSGCGKLTFQLSHSLSKSVSNLTDDSLYNNASEDEVDYAKVDSTGCEVVTEDAFKSGLLIDCRKKQVRRSLPPKKVRFSSQPPKVHVMRVWAFAAKQARAGHWERFALDRERFKRRIADVEVAVSWVLRPQHRSRVMFQRFMPWWNAEKRKELAEKKKKEDEKMAQEQVRLQEKIAEDALDNSLPEASPGEEKLQNHQELIVNDLQEHVNDKRDSIVGPSDVASSQSNAMDEEHSRVNDENKELVNSVNGSTSKHDNLSNHNVGEVGKQPNHKDANPYIGEHNNVNTEAVQDKEVDKPKHDDTIQKSNINVVQLQSGEVDNRLDDGPKFGELIQHEHEELNNQQLNDNKGDIDEESNTNDNGYKTYNLQANTKIDSNNTVNQLLNNIEDDLSVTNNDVGTERERRSNNARQNSQIVPYNDKILNIDLPVHTVGNNGLF